MLDQITLGQFESLLNKQFAIHVDGDKTVDMVLIEARGLPAQPGRDGQPPKRQPFALLFRGPRAFVLPQRIYEVEEASLGKLGIFLVPIGPDDSGQRYEAIFN